MEPKNLLLVDDDETFCEVTAILLKGRGYNVVTETDARKVMGLLRQGDFDVVLLDLMMPERDGLELLTEIRADWNVLPILVVSGFGSSEATVAAMRQGATDFVNKPVNASLLDLRIRSAYDLEYARRLANTDGLTGLYNHRHLQERLLEEIERSERYERPLSIVMADIDHFKRYNDSYGHPRGDEVLIAVSRTLRQVSRASDVAARYGGEEFMLILPETGVEEARVVAERARECVEALGFRCGDDPDDPPVTISLGIASYTPGGSKEALIKKADAALYEAKHQGRNRVCKAERGTSHPRRASRAGAPVALPIS